MRYLEDAPTVVLDAARCTGCGACTDVCPQAVLAIADGRAQLVDRGACIECGACSLNCESGALTVSPGVGCAAAIMRGWLSRGEPCCR